MEAPGSDKQSTVSASGSCLVGLIMDGLKTNNQTAEQETLVPTLPTMQLRLDATSSGATKKALDYFFHICGSTPQDLWTHYNA